MGQTVSVSLRASSWDCITPGSNIYISPNNNSPTKKKKKSATNIHGSKSLWHQKFLNSKQIHKELLRQLNNLTIMNDMQWVSYHIDRDHFVHATSQWEMVLHSNAISHWLDTYTEWSLHGPTDLQNTVVSKYINNKSMCVKNNGAVFFVMKHKHPFAF